MCGELEMKLPVGLVDDPTGKVILDPDVQMSEGDLLVRVVRRRPDET